MSIEYGVIQMETVHRHHHRCFPVLGKHRVQKSGARATMREQQEITRTLVLLQVQLV